MSRFLYSYLKLLRERKVYYELIIYCVTDWPVMYIWWFMLVPNNMTRKVLNINQNLSFTQTSCAYQGLAADYWYTVSQNSGPYLLSSFGVYEWYGKRYSVFVYWSYLCHYQRQRYRDIKADNDNFAPLILLRGCLLIAYCRNIFSRWRCWWRSGRSHPEIFKRNWRAQVKIVAMCTVIDKQGSISRRNQ